MSKFKMIMDIFNEACLYMLPGAEHIWGFNMAIIENSSNPDLSIYSSGLAISAYKSICMILSLSMASEGCALEKSRALLFLTGYIGSQAASYFAGKALNPMNAGLENALVKE